MDKLDMTPEQKLAFEGFIDVMVEIYKMTYTDVTQAFFIKNYE